MAIDRASLPTATAGRLRYARTPSATTGTATIAAKIGHRRRRPDAAGIAARVPPLGIRFVVVHADTRAWSGCRNASANSRAVDHRSAGDLANDWSTTDSSAWRAMIAWADPPEKGGCPASIS